MCTKVALEISLPEDLKELAGKFHSENYQLYVVGGAVRDAYLGQVPDDYDLATNALPEKVIELAKIRGCFVNEVGRAFGVVRVMTPDGNEYEIATFRTDIGYGRRPESVVFTTIEEDVKRRDLTMNALFYDITAKEIVDYVGGLVDIENGVVATVGDPHQRFEEDRLRVLRAIRFACRFGWQLSPETEQALRLNNSVDGVSPERIRDEFLKSVKSTKSVPRLMSMLTKFKMWKQIFPELTVAQIDIDTNNIPVLLASLLLGNKPTQVTKVLNKLKYTSDEVAQTRFLLQFTTITSDNSYKLKKQFSTSKLTNHDLTDFVSQVGLPSLAMCLAFIAYQPRITGDELLQEGYRGAELGSELERREVVRFKSMLKTPVVTNFGIDCYDEWAEARNLEHHGAPTKKPG